jgi:predicted AlkP superfamily pyrophosphatase or phosphodiesterase
MIQAGPSRPPVVPRYGAGALSDLLPSAAAALGIPGFGNVLELPPARQICVLLLDGFGWNLLSREGAHAPFLSATAAGTEPITVGFPSTTATSLTSLGTGQPPGRHGVLGYQVAVPGTGRLMNSLRWDPDVDPRHWQPHPTVFERAAEHGSGVFHVSPGAFRGSGLTVAGLRGTSYVPAETGGDLIAGAVASLRHEREALVYAYHSDLDKTGHIRGCGSDAWRHQLALTDRLVERLVATMPTGSLLVVTGDHGMVDVPPERRVDADAHPDLRTGVELLGGEPRARHVYTVPGAAADTLATWRDVLGDRAWVVSRQEAVDAGWFGPHVAPELLGRIGDVVAAATGDTSIVTPVDEPTGTLLVGHHGSLTADEQLVPLLLIEGVGDGA